MNEQESLEKIRQFVKKKYRALNRRQLRFHTFERSERLVKAAILLAGPLKLNQGDQFAITAAAWLHDIGYSKDPQDPGRATLLIAGDFLPPLKIKEELITKIEKLLMITPGFHQPLDQLEELMCDAGTSYLAKRSFLHQNELQRKEQSSIRTEKIDKMIWNRETVAWIADHRYFTAAARNLLEDKKLRNLTRLKSLMPEIQSDSANVPVKEKVTPVVRSLKKSKNFSDRGIDTMIRVASANSQRISAMADNKARILITVNAIILSAIISLVLKKLDQEIYLTYPTFLLIGVSLVTIVLAILAIRPHVSPGKFTQDQLESGEINMLFFGTFHQMALNDYRSAMLGIMTDNEMVYGTLIHDLHGQGAAVGRKYRLLRIAYTIFMFGLVISVIAFITTTAFHYREPVLSAAPVNHLK